MESFKASSILLTEEKQAIHKALTSSAPLDSEAQQALLRELQDRVSGEESGYFSVCHHHEEEAEHPLTPYVTDSGCLHPLRPYARDSEYFLQTQVCKLGPACKYNHILQTNQVLDDFFHLLFYLIFCSRLFTRRVYLTYYVCCCWRAWRRKPRRKRPQIRLGKTCVRSAFGCSWSVSFLIIWGDCRMIPSPENVPFYFLDASGIEISWWKSLFSLCNSTIPHVIIAFIL